MLHQDLVGVKDALILHPESIDSVNSLNWFEVRYLKRPSVLMMEGYAHLQLVKTFPSLPVSPDVVISRSGQADNIAASVGQKWLQGYLVEIAGIAGDHFLHGGKALLTFSGQDEVASFNVLDIFEAAVF